MSTYETAEPSGAGLTVEDFDGRGEIPIPNLSGSVHHLKEQLVEHDALLDEG